MMQYPDMPLLQYTPYSLDRVALGVAKQSFVGI